MTKVTRIRGSILSHLGALATAAEAESAKHLLSWQSQAILPPIGRPLGICRFNRSSRDQHMADIHWITMHRWNFDKRYLWPDVHENCPTGAHHHIIGRGAIYGPDVAPVHEDLSWGCMVFHETRASADTLLDAPAQGFPNMPDAAEDFHVLLSPIKFRGETTWFSRADSSLVLADKDPGGPVAVLTSAAYNDPDDPRAPAFWAQVAKVRLWYDSLPGNIVQSDYNCENGPGEGMTFTIWRDDKSLTEAAYGPGQHRTEMDYQFKGTPGHFDRSCFLRCRIVRHLGTWNGKDPVAQTIPA